MIRVLFVCHGNICRSPMAQFVLQDMVDKRGLSESFIIDSAATSNEEIGNDIHYGTRRMLEKEGVPFTHHYARRITRDDATKWDFIIGMDAENIHNIKRIMGPEAAQKTYKLLEFCSSYNDVADPWYTGNFEETYDDVVAGCTGFLQFLRI